MRKISKKISCTIMVLTVLVSSFFMGFESKAANTEFYVPYSEPTCDSQSGYISVISNYDGGSLYTYFWNLYGVWNDVGQPPDYQMYIKVNSNNVVFHPYVYGGNSAYLTLGYYDSTGNIHMIYYGSIGLNTYSRTETFGVGISGYCYGGNATGFDGNYRDVVVPNIHWNNSVDGQVLSYQITQVMGQLGNIDKDTSTIISELENIYNQNVSTNQKLDNMTTLLEKLASQSAEDKQAVDEFGSNTKEQSDKINGLNEQNTVEKIDTGQASSDVDAHIDTNAIANYGTVLSVFTGNSHILQYILIVLAVALISYVLFGKR